MSCRKTKKEPMHDVSNTCTDDVWDRSNERGWQQQIVHFTSTAARRLPVSKWKLTLTRYCVNSFHGSFLRFIAAVCHCGGTHLDVLFNHSQSLVNKVNIFRILVKNTKSVALRTAQEKTISSIDRTTMSSHLQLEGGFIVESDRCKYNDDTIIADYR